MTGFEMADEISYNLADFQMPSAPTLRRFTIDSTMFAGVAERQSVWQLFPFTYKFRALELFSKQSYKINGELAIWIFCVFIPNVSWKGKPVLIATIYNILVNYENFNYD